MTFHTLQTKLSPLYNATSLKSRLRQTASFLLAVSLLLSSVGDIALAAVHTNGEEGYITNVQGAERSRTTINLVDSSTGAFEYRYDFKLPKGRGPSSPSLELSYNSQNVSDQQMFGYGWDISIPYITRMNKTGVENIFSTTTTQYFASSQTGELVQVGTSSTFKTKFESGAFLEYQKLEDGWAVKDKDGLTYYFGQSTSSQQSSADDSTRVVRWMLEKIVDQNGNYTLYTYEKSNGVIYPDEITYTHATSSNALFKVEFVSSSTNLHTSYALGIESERDKVISEIKVYQDDDLIKKFTLGYDTGINDKRDLLTGITETGYDGVGGSISLPEVTFAYEGSQFPSWQTDSSYDFPEPLWKRDRGVRFGDVNGDGMTDMVKYYEQRDLTGGPQFVIRRVHINKGDGSWDIDVSWDWDTIDAPFHYFIDADNDKYYTLGVNLIDVNGDGLSDLVAAAGCEDECSNAVDALDGDDTGVYINTGSGFEKDTSWTVPNFTTWNQDHNFLRNEGRSFVDVNGDGLPDIVTAYFTTYLNGSPQANTYSSVLINTGSNWVSSDYDFPAPLALKSYGGSQTKRNFDDVGTRLADVNGDGLVDVLRGYEEQNSGPSNPNRDEKTVYLNTGDGWATTTSWNLPIEFITKNYAQGDKWV